MKKINFIIFLYLLLTISYVQLSKQDLPLNLPRKLEEQSNETILLGFDNYTAVIPNGYNNYTINFFTYFLFKNWNYTEVNFNDENIDKDLISFGIDAIMDDTNGNTNTVKFKCTYNKNIRISKYDDVVKFDLARYLCISNNNIKEGVPKIINFTNLTEEGIEINKYVKYSSSSSVEVFKKDLLNLKNKIMFYMDNDRCYLDYFDCDDYTGHCCPQIMRNATFISQNPNSFKIKSKRTIYESSNIQLLTKSNGNPKKVQCVGYEEKDKRDDEDYYYLETLGSNYLSNIDLNYAVANVTTWKTGDRIFILNFQEGVNATVLPEKVIPKKNSGGLSTGGIVGIIIASSVVLLGIAGLTFFLSRPPVAPPPPKNIINNTIGVASTEAVVNQ